MAIVVGVTVPTKEPYVRPMTPGPLATARAQAEERISKLLAQPPSTQRDTKVSAERDFIALVVVELAAGGR